MRAIILCAGMATRLKPVSLYTHKALLPIKGKPLIEHMIQYLHSHNITDITLVLGYKAEDFSYLADKYNVELRISDKWQTHNNYSSMQLVFDKLGDSLIIESDLLPIKDFIPLIDRDSCQCLAQNINGYPEWELICNENNRVLEVNRDSLDGLGLIGVAYLPSGEFIEDLKKEINACGPSEFWNDAFFRLLQTHPIYVRTFGDNEPILQEFDTVQDILRFNAMSYEDLAKNCSQTGMARKLEHSKYEIQYNGKICTILFTDNGVILND